MQKVEYYQNGTQIFYEIKKSKPWLQMADFAKLSFCSGGKL